MGAKGAAAAAGDVYMAAEAYLRRGWAIVPVPYRKKAPGLPNWPQLRLTPGDLGRYFNGRPGNVGLLLGSASGGLVDIDLDAPEAQAVAGVLLPATPAMFGRAGKPRSHRLYVCADTPQTVQFRAPDGTTLVELRADGCQTIAPPSVHPSGELVAWAVLQECAGRAQGPGVTLPEPARVPGDVLARAVRRLAAAALLARAWPGRGSRHEAALALAGALARAGWSVGNVERFVSVVSAAAGDEELWDRMRAAGDVWRRQAAGAATTGLRRLAALVDERAVAAAGWLGLERPGTAHSVLRNPGPPADRSERCDPHADGKGTGGVRSVGKAAASTPARGHADAGHSAASPAGMWEPPVPLLVHEVPEFPIDRLPECLARYVAHVAIATQTPPDLAGMLALAVLAAAAQGRIGCTCGRGGRSRCPSSSPWHCRPASGRRRCSARSRRRWWPGNKPSASG